MLKSHLDSVENALIAKSKIPSSAGHTLHKGTPREIFIREFLMGHLSEKVAIGSGEIIDANSKPGQSRNQHDIVIYKREFPKLDFGGDISGFLAESVVATIEVKSNLTQTDFQNAMRSAKNTKSFQRNFGGIFSAGYRPPSILTFLIAYDGPVSMSTVHGWVEPFMTQEGLADPPMGNTLDERMRVIAPCLDGIFVLGKGFMNYDNCPISLLDDSKRSDSPAIRWTLSDIANGSLLMLFLILTNSLSRVSATSFNPLPYVQSTEWSNVKFMS